MGYFLLQADIPSNSKVRNVLSLKKFLIEEKKTNLNDKNNIPVTGTGFPVRKKIPVIDRQGNHITERPLFDFGFCLAKGWNLIVE